MFSLNKEVQVNDIEPNAKRIFAFISIQFIYVSSVYMVIDERRTKCLL